MSDEETAPGTDSQSGRSEEELTGRRQADDDGEELEKRRKELEQRERGLDDYAAELEDREDELNERDRNLRQRKKKLDQRVDSLDQRDNRITERESELDDRETAIQERERELSERADTLDQKEKTLQQYVNESTRETVEAAVHDALEGLEDSIADVSSRGDIDSRLGTIGSLILGLVGVTLVIAGVLNGFAAEIEAVPIVFDNDTANLGVTVMLLFSGLAANLAAVAD